jgi:hypothetical protein
MGLLNPAKITWLSLLASIQAHAPGKAGAEVELQLHYLLRSFSLWVLRNESDGQCGMRAHYGVGATVTVHLSFWLL